MLCIDIETIPTGAALAAPLDPAVALAAVPANYKSEEAIAKFVAKYTADYEAAKIKTASLNPRLGRVLCLGYLLGNDSPKAVYAEDANDEADLLRQFWALVEDAEALPIVTWNGAFDLRFLWVRSLRHRIVPSRGIGSLFRRYSTDPHCDVKAFLLQEWGSRIAGEGLDEWAAFLDLPTKPDGMGGSEVYPAYLRHEHERIMEYCLHDVRTTALLYRAIQPSL